MKLKATSVRISGIAFTGLFGLTLAAATIPGAAQPPKKNQPVVGNIESGKKVYAAQSCANCHAINGEGGSSGPDLSTIGLDKTHTAAWFKKAIVTPKALHKDSSMPAFDKLSAKDLADLTAYLTSLKKKAGS